MTSYTLEKYFEGANNDKGYFGNLGYRLHKRNKYVKLWVKAEQVDDFLMILPDYSLYEKYKSAVNTVVVFSEFEVFMAYKNGRKVAEIPEEDFATYFLKYFGKYIKEGRLSKESCIKFLKTVYAFKPKHKVKMFGFVVK